MTTPSLKYVLVLSKDGRKRLQNLYNQISSNTTKILKVGVSQEIKKIAVEKAPSFRQEAIAISAPGLASEIQFFKRGTQISIHDAIEKEPIEVTKTDKGYDAYFGKKSRINRLIGFSWGYREEDGSYQTASTDDPQAGSRWRKLIELFEYGGTFTVHGRPLKGGGYRKLFLKPGDYRDKVKKTVQPWHIFSDARIEGEKDFRNFVETSVKEIARGI